GRRVLVGRGLPRGHVLAVSLDVRVAEERLIGPRRRRQDAQKREHDKGGLPGTRAHENLLLAPLLRTGGAADEQPPAQGVPPRELSASNRPGSERLEASPPRLRAARAKRSAPARVIAR